MKIDSYAISLQSQHEFKASYTRSETLNSWQDSKDPNSNDGSINRTGIRQWIEDQLKLSEQAKEALKREARNIAGLSVDGVSSSDDLSYLSDKDKQKILILESMLSALTGRKIKILVPRQLHTEDTEQSMAKLSQKIARIKAPASGNQPARVRQGWGFTYDRNESYQESEQLSFSASGILRTSTGQEIDFSVQLRMSREFAVNNNLSIRGGDALLDPLVINYDGSPAQLTSQKYSFDLDADGREDQISFVNEGSGFLALDSNNDGIINNGKELFGPSTGNGFTELAAYDQDQNGWIDENDPIFDKLRIWTKDTEGNDSLFALGEKGIGAIFLGNISAQFGLKDAGNQTLGEARTAGVFVKENGSAGVVQQIDLVV